MSFSFPGTSPRHFCPLSSRIRYFTSEMRQFGRVRRRVCTLYALLCYWPAIASYPNLGSRSLSAVVVYSLVLVSLILGNGMEPRGERMIRLFLVR